MKQANVRVDTPDNLTVKFEYKSKHTVGGRMLWAKIDGEIAKAGFRHGELMITRAPLVPAGRRTKVKLRLAIRGREAPYSCA
jgi:hypothetical protein